MFCFLFCWGSVEMNLEYGLIAALILVSALSAGNALHKPTPVPGATWHDKTTGSACVVTPELPYEEAIKRVHEGWAATIDKKPYRLGPHISRGGKDCPDGVLVGTTPAEAS